MSKFKVGEEFSYEKNGKVYSGEILHDFGKTYLIAWHHAIGTYYLPKEIIDQYNKKELENVNTTTINAGAFYSGFPSSGQGNGAKQIRKT